MEGYFTDTKDLSPIPALPSPMPALPSPMPALYPIPVAETVAGEGTIFLRLDSREIAAALSTCAIWPRPICQQRSSLWAPFKRLTYDYVFDILLG